MCHYVAKVPRPVFWLKYTDATWLDSDTTTVFRGRIARNEAKDDFADLTGVQVQVILSRDFPYLRTLTRDVTIAPDQVSNKGAFQFTFLTGELPVIGLWKIEVMMKTNGNQIGITHHEDFDVV